MSGPIAVVVERDVVDVVGPDAETYLQGQLSQDLAPLAVGGSAWTFVLQPQGKVDAWFRITRTGEDGFRADVDAGHGEALLARLQRFLLRTKAELTRSTVPMVAVRGTGDVEIPVRAVALDPAWPGVAGIDLLGVDTVPPGLDDGTVEDLERLRIESGVPAMGRELTDRTIPAESGVVPRSVSFTKGCFTGQELVARIDSRGGNVPRHLRVVRSAGADLAPGAEVVVGDSAVGEITSSAGDVALAYVGRAVEVPAEGVVDGIAVAIETTP